MIHKIDIKVTGSELQDLIGYSLYQRIVQEDDFHEEVGENSPRYRKALRNTDRFERGEWMAVLAGRTPQPDEPVQQRVKVWEGSLTMRMVTDYAAGWLRPADDWTFRHPFFHFHSDDGLTKGRIMSAALHFLKLGILDPEEVSKAALADAEAGVLTAHEPRIIKGHVANFEPVEA